MFGKSKQTLITAKIPIAGLRYYRAQELASLMHKGDELSLIHEADNPHDENAVAVMWNRNLIGYLPRQYCAQIVELLKTQKIFAKITAIEPHEDASQWVILDIYARREKS